MSSKIYYFSGTGNSLAVARETERNLIDEGSIVSIASLKNEKNIQVDTDVLGFVFPVYCMSIPDIVKAFIEKLSFKSKPYIFAIVTCNGVPGKSLIELNKYLLSKGKELSSGFVVEMTGNAVVTPSEIVTQRLDNYKTEVVKISNIISNRSVKKIVGTYGIKDNIGTSILKSFGRKMYLTPKSVSSTSECIGCGICTKVCPLDNIQIVDKKPGWGVKCSTCLACFHWCPKNAVKGGLMLSRRNQYHNPEVSVKDMELQKI